VEDVVQFEANGFSVIGRSLISPKDGSVKHFSVIRPATAWANILALDKEKRAVMIRQFRKGSRSFSLKLPGGKIDRGETPLEAAIRELQEETYPFTEGEGRDTLA
jgi:ADP-ribose pyrophosphatase